MNCASLYACPVCENLLEKVEQSYRCVSGHSFDCHKKGYVNLLLAQHKNTKAPGDNADMVKGRHEFLRAGYYQAFAQAIVNFIREPCSHQERLTLLDAGCGEGYYSEYVQQHMVNAEVYGVDISKPAIASAARCKTVHWSVASSHRLPFVGASFDFIMSVFSPVDEAAFLRVLKPGGFVLYAGPGREHLASLRAIVYDQVNEYLTEKHQDYFGQSFQLIKERSLQVPLQLDSQAAISQLLAMTPHAHRLSAKGRERLADTHALKDVGDFKLYLYQKA